MSRLVVAPGRPTLFCRELEGGIDLVERGIGRREMGEGEGGGTAVTT